MMQVQVRYSRTRFRSTSFLDITVSWKTYTEYTPWPFSLARGCVAVAYGKSKQLGREIVGTGIEKKVVPNHSYVHKGGIPSCVSADTFDCWDVL